MTPKIFPNKDPCSHGTTHNEHRVILVGHATCILLIVFRCSLFLTVKPLMIAHSLNEVLERKTLSISLDQTHRREIF